MNLEALTEAQLLEAATAATRAAREFLEAARAAVLERLGGDASPQANVLDEHGGNGYALESEASRILCDARILNIFEGAAEIQAHVVGRGLLRAS